MATSKTTTVAPGVTRDDHFWGYDLTGMKEALLTSGLAKEEWFWNGRRASDGRRLTVVHFKIGVNRARCHPTYGDKSQYTIEVHYPKAQAEIGRRAQQQEQGAERAKNLLMIGLGSVATAFNWSNNQKLAYGFPAETIEQLEQKMGAILRLFESGGFQLRLGPVPEGSADFQRFMQRATSTRRAAP